MASEDDRIARLADRFRTAHAHVVVGIGDDAAVLAPHADATVLSVDTSVEGVHFRRAFGLEGVGYRAVVAALSDLAAMGATPTAVLLAFALPKDLDEADFDRLIEGTARAAERYDVPIVGGNLSRAGELSITTTVVGRLDGAPWRRDGAKPGNAIFVTGPLGARALGLRALEAKRDDANLRPFIEAWKTPNARFDVIDALGPHVHAAIDVSDGLLRDLGHLAEASGVGAIVEVAALPRAAGFDEAARSLGEDPDTLALTGGEDYELLVTAANDAPIAAVATRIGVIVEGEGVRVLDADGSDVTPSRGGFDHFE